MAKRPGRQRHQLPHCYFEGFLEKRSFKDKKSRKLWASLCGHTVFFYNDKRESEYIEKLDLTGLVSVTDDNSIDRNLDAARLNLQMKDGLIKLTLPNAEARELWKGFLYSVALLSVPTSINLLPGQIHTLKETVEKEIERRKSSPPPVPVKPSSHIDLPTCFHKVSRVEAELLLDKEAQRGNLLLRPGRDGNTYAVTTRQDFNGPVYKHYRVTSAEDGGYSIDVDNPVQCATLQEVVNSLVQKTDGVLIPLPQEQQYARKISFIRSDNENGERTEQNACVQALPPVPPPKPVTTKVPTEPLAAVTNIYLNEGVPLQNSSEAPPRPRSSSYSPEVAGNSQIIMPPVPAPRKNTPTTSASLCIPSRDAKMRTHVDPLSQTISELKLKLERQAKCLE
ncbi:signal-transducing adaptor protein 1-like isoform X1 [Synchiropus splendidus]|uniref:signal-transducing adaptor protein 1-like isoform X1 n=1 Tax=Synchiropus splendidus TaxID=270530 RepID=UPI00237EBDB9|nr:signal-transducing adaptor protein 1-like isoform X1 [Synchiropus splendidus]